MEIGVREVFESPVRACQGHDRKRKVGVLMDGSLMKSIFIFNKSLLRCRIWTCGVAFLRWMGGIEEHWPVLRGAGVMFDVLFENFYGHRVNFIERS